MFLCHIEVEAAAHETAQHARTQLDCAANQKVYRIAVASSRTDLSHAHDGVRRAAAENGSTEDHEHMSAVTACALELETKGAHENGWWEGGKEEPSRSSASESGSDNRKNITEGKEGGRLIILEDVRRLEEVRILIESAFLGASLRCSHYGGI